MPHPLGSLTPCKFHAQESKGPTGMCADLSSTQTGWQAGLSTWNSSRPLQDIRPPRPQKSPENQWALSFAGSQGHLQGDQGILGNTKTVPAASGQQFIPGNHTATSLTCSTLFLGTLANPQEECRAGTSPQSMVAFTDQALCQELQYRSCQLQK